MKIKIKTKPLSWWKQWWFAELLIWLFPKTIKSIIQEELTMAIHPDFGYVWTEDRSDTNHPNN